MDEKQIILQVLNIIIKYFTVFPLFLSAHSAKKGCAAQDSRFPLASNMPTIEAEKPFSNKKVLAKLTAAAAVAQYATCCIT